MSNKTVSSTATARLKQDYLRLMRDPVPYVTATPLANNILCWHYVVRGPIDTPYHGGYYHGKLFFPREFPFKPPAIYMITPNGRFKVNQKLCLSISDFHPDTWNPAWSVSTILTGLLSFMVENTPTSGSTESSDGTKRRLAQESKVFNMKDKIFVENFPDLVDEINDILKKKRAAEEELAKLQSETNLSNLQTAQNLNNNTSLKINPNSQSLIIPTQNWMFSILSNVFAVMGLAAFAYVVKYVFSTTN